MRSDHWAKEDSENFIKIYPYYTNNELIKLFYSNKTKKQLQNKAYLLKLKKTEEAFMRAREEANIKTGISHTGKVHTEEHNKHLSEAKIGVKTGKQKSPRRLEHSQKLSFATKNRGAWTGNKNPRSINPLYGKDNGRWNNGSKQLYWDLREFIHPWKNASMEFWNYKCAITGNSFREIHHVYPFRKIVNDVFNNLRLDIRKNLNDYTLEEREKIREELLIEHEKYPIGICLEKQIHKDFHDKYGYRDFDFNDFLKFIEGYANTEVITKIKNFVKP